RALRQAVEDEEAALDAAVAKHRGEIDRDLRKALDKARSEYLKLLDSLIVKHAELSVREAELRWVHGGKWIPTGRPGLAEIPQRNGDPIHVETVLEALRSRGVAPEPKPK